MDSVKLLLFDLDGTLMLSGGAGKRAFETVFRRRFGIEDAFRGIVPDGKMDPLIFLEIFKFRGIALDDEERALRELSEEYRAELALEMPKSAKARLMPGVTELLKELQGRPGAAMGLLTGNFEPTARIKLDRFDLNRFFPFGAFSSDRRIRSELVPVAVERAEAHLGRKIGIGRHVYVIGDTPNDVECALANDVSALGVAAANYSMDELRAAGAHICLPDFSDTRAVLSAMEMEA